MDELLLIKCYKEMPPGGFKCLKCKKFKTLLYRDVEEHIIKFHNTRQTGITQTEITHDPEEFEESEEDEYDPDRDD